MKHNYDLHGMLLGVATASTQIEGNETNNNWYDWYKKGHIKDNSDPNIATKHYELYKEDIELLKKMKIQCIRLSLEWSRIEPNENEFNQEALNHYKEELHLLNENGIKPLVTLWHFSNPMWFENKGAFLNKDAKNIFMKYAEKVIVELGNEVEAWVTINEPNVYALNGYMSDEWPPEENNFFKMIKVNNTFVDIHIACYEMIHKYYPNAKVGSSLHVRSFMPKNKNNIYHIFATKMVKDMFQTNLARAMNYGVYSFPYKACKKGKYYDFIGINYYARTCCSGFSNGTRENCAKNDLDWEIYPEGLRELVKEYYNKYKAPIYITENGTCDNNDAFRCLYLYEHFNQIKDLEFVQRYYHWCFVDNFEWAEGMSAKFGIVQIDYPNQNRTIKKSGYFYTKMIENNGVTEEMYKEYVENEKYNIR